MNSIDEKIIAYMEYLKKQGYYASLHIPCVGCFEKLLPYGIHTNPYCLLVKSKKEAWDKCISCQKSVLDKCLQKKPFFGMCYAGVSEYVFPVGRDSEIVGWISVSGYRDNENKALLRMKTLNKEYGFDGDELKSAYYKYLRNELPSFSETEAVIYPLCAMAELAELKYGSRLPDCAMDTNADYIYAHAVIYIENNYRSKITVDTLSEYCHCSRSYLSHIFKKRSGKSINAFTNRIRLENAKKVLEETNLSMSEIADALGFSDSNYFTKLFKELYGISPTKYRIKNNLT